MLRRVAEFLESGECKPDKTYALEASDGCEKLLIAGDQIISNSIREYIEELSRRSGKKVAVRVASIFDGVRQIKREGDLVFKNELELRKFLNSGKTDKIIADPLVEQLLTAETKAKGVKFFGLPHTAVSSKICWDKTKLFLSKEFETFVKEIL